MVGVFCVCLFTARRRFGSFGLFVIFVPVALDKVDAVDSGESEFRSCVKVEVAVLGSP